MKYMVMECHFSYAVVLAEDGRFLNVANMHYEVGQTVSDIIEMQRPVSQPLSAGKSRRRWLYSFGTLAACLVLAVTVIFQMGQQLPYASVYMSINPEVRIDVNRNDIVVGLEGINEDGKELIADYSYKKKELDLVMDELVDTAIDMGYLHEGGQITLTLDAEDSQWVMTHSDTLQHELNNYLTEKISVTIDIEISGQEAETAPPPQQQITIPVGESDYGASDYGEAPTVEEAPSLPAVHPTESPYESKDDGQTDYGTDEDDLTNYGASEDDSNDGDVSQSNYEEQTYDDGQSAYSSEDGDSPYSESSDNGSSDYDD